MLIVDDDPAVLELLSEGLRKYKGQFEVLSALDSEDALSMLGSKRISVVVMDLGVPRTKGLELLVRIRKKHPQIPCIAITAPAGLKKKEMERVPLEGVFDCIEKPVDVNELAGLVLAGLECLDEGVFWKAQHK